MRSFVVICAISLAVVSAGIAGTPVGNVISKDPISVNGITAPAGTYIPLEVGAEVSTRTAPALVQFADGTTVNLGPNSQLKVDGNVGSPEFHIVRGSAQYKLGPAARPRVTSGSTSGDGVATMAAARSSVQPPPAALVSSSTPASVIRPSSPVITGGFAASGTSSGASFQGYVTGAANGVLTSFTTPSGLTINLTPSVSADGSVSYTIASVTQTATNAQGQTVTVTVTAFNGDTITVAPPSTPGTTTSTATISTPSGAPVSPTTVTTTVTTTATSQGATVPTPGVSTGSFSGTAN